MTWLHRVLRLAIPECSVDYLPPPPAPFRPLLVSIRLAACSGSQRLPSSEHTHAWLVSAGLCRVKVGSAAAASAANAEGGDATATVFVELEDAESWERALALNGRCIPPSSGVVQGAVDDVIMEGDSNSNSSATGPPLVVAVKPCQLDISSTGAAIALESLGHFSSVPSQALMLHWLRLLAVLPRPARKRVVQFLAPSSVQVPGDFPSIEEALAAGASSITLASGSVHHLPQGLSVHGRVELIGELGVELVLGAPITVSSMHGAIFQNLTMRSAFGTSDDVDDADTSGRNLGSTTRSLSTLIRVNSSYITAVGKGYAKYSEMTPKGPRRVFAACSWGQPPVVLNNCRLFGARHGVEARGGSGLYSPQREASLDLAAWLARCRALSFNKKDRLGLDAFRFEIEHVSERKVILPSWSTLTGTHVRLVDCEIAGATADAVSAWRGALVDMQGTWVHHCGQGVTVSQCPEDLRAQNLASFPTQSVRVCVARCCFEDLAKHAWSCAVSVGRPITDGRSKHRMPDVSEAAVSSKCCALEAVVRHNVVRRCSIGISASNARLLVDSNHFVDVALGGLQLCDVGAELNRNDIDLCGGTGIALSSGSSTHSGLVGQLLDNRIRRCALAVRVTSAAGAISRVKMQQDVIESSNDEGLTVIGKGSRLEVSRCDIRGCNRFALRVGRGAHAMLEGCSIVGNGRGIAVAAWAAADVRRCHFEGNVGWAVRLEGAAEDVFSPAQRPPGSQCVIAENVFGGVSRGSILCG
eukprot:gnl/TRDRNA2_/TRDRNA2_164039_c6_seq2.p1 gnl/TRDRNA2_/TRDRNA2_164039_c6~~gnl/TRDRNA2_/TRDRNA2_164039_c6_seq2.p1  ORF type:complete len:755 (+),score=82.03 gnl/TRDRNA2_/TRDRNA2_164039_c6_seq2:122-2386(+)